MKLGLPIEVVSQSSVVAFNHRSVSQLERSIKLNCLDAEVKCDLHRDRQGKSSAK